MDQTWKLDHNGKQRRAEVHVPEIYDPEKPTPLVLDFHGFLSQPDQQRAFSGMNDKADKEGFVAIQPTGLSNSWNAGKCCGFADTQDIDDVGFIEKLIKEASSKLCIDEKRVYATGLSNGGMMSYRLACELSEKIAAIAPVAGLVMVPECAPKRPVAIMHFHGTDDGMVPYRKAPESIATWEKANECSGETEVTFEHGDAKCETHKGCKDQMPVTFCTIDTGGHTWPDSKIPVPAGKTTKDINATDKMWEFFVNHPMP